MDFWIAIVTNTLPRFPTFKEPFFFSKSTFLHCYDIINEITISQKHNVRFLKFLSWNTSYLGNSKKDNFELLTQLVHFDVFSHILCSPWMLSLVHTFFVFRKVFDFIFSENFHILRKFSFFFLSKLAQKIFPFSDLNHSLIGSLAL